MILKYLGHSSFFIGGRDKSVVTDPFNGIGYEIERVNAEFCTVSHNHFDHNYIRGVNVSTVVDKPCNGFLAIDSFHDSNLGSLRGKNTIFKFVVDGITVCHMGDIGEYYSDSLAEEIGETDVLLLPVGGKYTIDGKEAAVYTHNLHAKITIPMHYKTPKSNLDIDCVDKYLACIYNKVVTAGEEIELNKDNLPFEPTVIVMNNKRI